MPEAKPKGAAAMETDHSYQMPTTSKRKSPNTPTKAPTPPNKVVVAQVTDSTDSALVEAIRELTEKMNGFGAQLTKNSVKLSQNSNMISNLSKLAEMNAADIKECNTKLNALEKTVLTLSQDVVAMRERRWNLKIKGMKEKYNENTR